MAFDVQDLKGAGNFEDAEVVFYDVLKELNTNAIALAAADILKKI